MRHKQFSLALVGLAVLGLTSTVSAQVLQLGSNDNPVTVPDTMNLSIISESGLIQSGVSKAMARLQTAGSSLGTFDYNFVASKDGNPYTATIVGRSPFLRGK